MSEIKEKVFDLLEEITEYENLRDCADLDLLGTNILDSLSFILLLERLDDELGIEIQPTQVDPAVWRTPASIAAFIEEKAIQNY